MNIIAGGGGNLEGVGAVTKGSLDDGIVCEGDGAELVDVSIGLDEGRFEGGESSSRPDLANAVALNFGAGRKSPVTPRMGWS